MSVQIERRTFTVDDLYRMVEVGLLSEDERVELIEGEVLRMSTIGKRHAACVARLTKLFARLAGDEAIVWAQNPLKLSDVSQLQPDVTLLRARADFYASSLPTPTDVLLLVEVADTSVGYDRQVKVPLYAGAGVPEVWLIDLTTDTVEIYSQPGGGVYQTTSQAKRGETISAQGVAGLSLTVEEIIG